MCPSDLYRQPRREGFDDAIELMPFKNDDPEFELVWSLSAIYPHNQDDTRLITTKI
jgi:hypothetical protein